MNNISKEYKKCKEELEEVMSKITITLRLAQGNNRNALFSLQNECANARNSLTSAWDFYERNQNMAEKITVFNACKSVVLNGPISTAKILGAFYGSQFKHLNNLQKEIFTINRELGGLREKYDSLIIMVEKTVEKKTVPSTPKELTTDLDEAEKPRLQIHR